CIETSASSRYLSTPPLKKENLYRSLSRNAPEMCRKEKSKGGHREEVTKRESEVTTSFSWKPGSLQRLIYPSFPRVG
ncbi:hypothetical protein CDAR_235811, partial [Caerostris darwini]